MATLYVHIANQCKSDARKHGVIKDVEKLAEKIETIQSDRGLEHFPKPYRKKSMGRHGRLVIEEHRQGNALLLCFVRYLVRSSSEYSTFCQDTEKYYERHRTSQTEVESIVAKRSEHPIEPKRSLENIELTYLQSSRMQASVIRPYGSSDTFLESYEWFDRLSKKLVDNKPQVRDDLERYHELILDIESSLEASDRTVSSHEDDPTIRILYRKFPHYNRTYLIAPVDTQDPEDEAQLRKRYSQLLTDDDITPEELIRHSRRAYSTQAVYQESSWERIERSNKANIARSPEENRIIASVLGTLHGQNKLGQPADQSKYPLFINGRPGSGKSTILQCLFADRLIRYIELRESTLTEGKAPLNPPLYLTYSPQLLKEARTTVQEILTSNSRIFENDGELTQDRDLETLLSLCFRDFRSFLKSLLPPNIRPQFADGYIDFRQFKQKWNSHRLTHPIKAVRKIGPELAWHVIRTFIKGTQRESGVVIDPECYRFEIGRDDKSVSDPMFAFIFTHVWEHWYEPLCEQENYWDDQDLARAVLNYAADRLFRYPVIFCDEAQDFTRIELELIEQLSVYSSRTIPSYLVKDVPFAFAGDPYQTLNPTGFNWGTLQSSFHEKIARQLDPTHEANLQFNYKDLSFNYRSAEPIVRLSNLIQLLRATLLQIKALHPQKSWTRKTSASPVWYDWGDETGRASLRKQTELVIIVPCQENGELEYVQNDAFLSEIAIRRDDRTGEPVLDTDGNPMLDRNILSPALAKGLEFRRVLLYGFGQQAIDSIPLLINHIRDPQQDPPAAEQRLICEYFLNQLYVAVSRARKRLFIVDSSTALEQFWSFTEYDKQNTLLTLYKAPEIWKSVHVGGIERGEEDSWENEQDDQLAIAQQFQAQGQAARDAYLLSRASANYRAVEKLNEALFCEALSYEYEDKLDQAARIFADLGQWDDACRCYWRKKDAKAVVGLVKDFPNIAEDSRFVAAQALTRDTSTAEQIKATLTATESVTPQSFVEDPTDLATWRWFFEGFVIKMSETLSTSVQPAQTQKENVDQLILTIQRFELPLVDYPEIPKLLYLVGEAAAALALYKQSQANLDNGPKWVLQAQAEVEPYPTNVRHYHQLGNHAAAIAQWNKAERQIDNTTPTRLLLESAASLKDITAVKQLLPLCDEFSHITKALKQLPGSERENLGGALAVAIVNTLIANGKWRAIHHFASDEATIHDDELAAIVKDSAIQMPQKIRRAAIIRVVARSKKLEQVSSKSIKEKLPLLLKRALIVGKNASLEQRLATSDLLQVVGMDEAGMAFERAFRLTLALKFYEQFFMPERLAYITLVQTHQQTDFAKRRWLACNYRLNNVKEGRFTNTEYADKADAKAKEWDISPASVAQSEPSLPTLSEIVPLPENYMGEPLPKPKPVLREEKPAENLIKVGDRILTVEKINFKHCLVLTDSNFDEKIECTDREVTSENVEIVRSKELLNGSEWTVPSWQMICEISSSKEGTVIFLRRTDRSLIKKYEFLAATKLATKLMKKIDDTEPADNQIRFPDR